MFKLMDKKIITILRKLFLTLWECTSVYLFIIPEYEVERLKKAVDALMVSNAEKVNKYIGLDKRNFWV